MFMVEATRFAIDRASDEELLGLQEYVYQMENCTDPEKTASLIFEFSHEIAYISGNTLLPLFFVSFRDLVCSLWVRYGQKYGTKELYYSAKKSLTAFSQEIKKQSKILSQPPQWRALMAHAPFIMWISITFVFQKSLCL